MLNERLLLCSLFICFLQVFYAAVVPTTTLSSTTQDLTTATTHVPDTKIRHGLNFYYHHRGLEHLLLAHSRIDCFVMPLSNKDVQDILDPKKLRLMEEHMMSQIGKHLFITWTYDDYEVRDKGWSDGCKEHNGTIYRVYRL